MKYILTLTDEDSVILRQWNMTDEAGDVEADASLPLRLMGPEALAEEINNEIEVNEKQKEGR